jgi:HB1, ASXL, restriction endonuclease HTH domain
MGSKKTTKTKARTGKGKKSAKADAAPDTAPLAVPAADATGAAPAGAAAEAPAETAHAPAPDGAAGDGQAAKASKRTKAGADPVAGKLSQLGAAAKVLAEEGRPMTCKEMVEVMAARGYWESPAGKTPWATLYSAMLRELTTKGERSRFAKAERGKFSRTPTA